MIFFFKSDGTLIKSAPETVYQGSAEAGKVYVVAPLNANMLVDVYYELPNGERWGAYLLENNGTVINNEELPDGWALWSTTLESAITQYAGTLKAQFGFYQSGTADKVPLITSQGVTITIAKGVVRDVFPDSPAPSVYEYLTSTISTIKQNFDNLPNEYLSNTNEDKIALKNNTAIEYSENATAGTIAKRDSDGKINVADGTEDLNAVNVRQLNAALEKKVDASSVSSAAVKDTIAQRTDTGQLKAADGVADDDLATVKQLNAVQGNYTDITNIDLNTGDTTVEYDTELGITVNAKGTLTHKNGATEQPTTKFELPIVGTDGIVIDKAQNEEKISVKVDGKVTKTPNSIVKRDSAGRVKTADAVSDEDATSYGQHTALLTYTDSELLKKLDRTGGTITGNLIVSGNLSVSGEASVIESTTLKVADKLIYVAKDNTSALTSPAGLITPKYDGTNDGGIVYDNSGTAYVGDIKLDSNGNVDVNNSDLQPIATRDNYSNFTNGHKVKVEVDSLQKSVKFVDGGKDDGINTLTDINLTLGDTTVQYDTTDGIQLNSIARFTGAAGNHDAMMDIAIPIVGTDGIVIDKAQNEEKISVKVDGKVTKTPNSIVKRDSAGRVKTADAVSDEDATSYGQHTALLTYTDSELLKKLDRTGGTITGNLIVSGNLSVSGEASVIESTTLKVADKLIYVAKDNTSALTSPAGLITPKYDGTNDGGIVYDNSGTAYVGDIKLDSNGNVDVNNSDLQPIATRDNYSNFTNGHKVKVEVDSLQKSVKFVDGGKDDGINTLTDINLTLGDTTVQYDTTDGIQLNSIARFTGAAGNHDAMMDIAIPIVGTDGIVIDKAADSEKIEISGKNFPQAPYSQTIARQILVYDENNKTYGYRLLDDASLSSGSIPFYRDPKQATEPYLNNSIYTGDPKSDYAAANKKYVDDGLVAKVDISENFVKVFTIPNGTSTGTLAADVKEKLCNPDGHNYYVFDDTSQMILKYSFNADDEIIQYKAIYLQTDKAYEITMQILPSNGSWRRSQTILNGGASSVKLYLHSIYFGNTVNNPLLTFYHTSLTHVTDKWIYDNLTGNKYYLSFMAAVSSIYQYGAIGFAGRIGQTSSSPSWGAVIDFSSSGYTQLSVSNATQYTVTEI